MRVAVLSDIHGNVPALNAVLNDVATEGADAVVLNGDIAAGPLPVETLDLLEALGDRGVWVRGNCDRLMVEAYDLRRSTWPEVEAFVADLHDPPGDAKMLARLTPPD